MCDSCIRRGDLNQIGKRFYFEYMLGIPYRCDCNLEISPNLGENHKIHEKIPNLGLANAFLS